jgi:hypothetical protein
MKAPELLQTFNDLLDSFETRRGYIDKAKTQAKKFKPEVIEKVVRDHELKSTEISDKILPLVPQMQSELGALEESRDGAREEKVGIDEQMEELDLRKAIGELGENAYESASSELRVSQIELEERLEEIQSGRDTLDTALQRWKSLAGQAGVETGEKKESKKKRPEPKPEPRAAEAKKPRPVLDYAEPVVDEEPIVDERAGGERETILGGMREDVSAVFEEMPAAAAAAAIEAISVDDVEAIAVGEVEEDIIVDEDAGPSVSWKGPPATDEDEQMVLEQASGELAIESEPEVGIPVEGASEEPRRALLLYQEGTAEEQIYPFTGDTLTIGRGRDNDIQIKNDSKVSRFHCKLYRKGNNFYIEDNKSSNGSLVNGELITERRLFGGEELIIGETFFRFRIM